MLLTNISEIALEFNAVDSSGLSQKSHLSVFRTNVLEETRNQVVCLEILFCCISGRWFSGHTACLSGATSCQKNFILLLDSPPSTPSSFLLGLLIHDPLFICRKRPYKRHKELPSVKSALLGLKAMHNDLKLYGNM